MIKELTDKEIGLMKLSDLHVHLGATTSEHVLWEIAHEQGIKLPTKDYRKFITSMRINGSMEHDKYHDKFKLTQMIQSSPMAIEKSVYHAISSAYRKCNITTIEIRFNPIFRNNEGFYDLDQIIYHATVGMKKACLVYPVKAGLIIEVDKTFDKKRANILAQKAVKYKNDGVVGFDASGRSAEGIDELVEAFAIAKKGGLGLTFHTGEIGEHSADEMYEVIKRIEPDRIGHGIKCIYDEKLLKAVVDNDIILEICPTSNLKLGAVKDIDQLHHILDILTLNRIRYCINSDGPVFFDTSVSDEYKLLYSNKIMTANEVIKHVEESHKYSFL